MSGHLSAHFVATNSSLKCISNSTCYPTMISITPANLVTAATVLRVELLQRNASSHTLPAHVVSAAVIQAVFANTILKLIF